jgi:hypothetical protein
MKIIGSVERGAAGLGQIVLNGQSYPTIQAAMDAIAAADQLITLGPGTYQEDVTWTKWKNCAIIAQIPNTVTIEAVTAFAVKMDPALTDAKTWTGTLQGLALNGGDNLVGLQVDNSLVAARMNIMLNDVDIENDNVTDHSIDVNRTGSAAIRLYASGRGHTIEGLVAYTTESTDDRVRFWGYRLVGGITITGNIVMEVTFVNCGILTSGESYGTGNVSNHFGCYNETDANPNVHTVVSDDDETSH